jgi:hypothetical protein
MLSLVMKTISAQNKVCEKNNNISANEMKFRKIYKLYFITVEILNNLSDLFFFSYKISTKLLKFSEVTLGYKFSLGT